MHVHHNTFRVPGRRAVVIRGTPEDQAVEHNWFYHRTERGAIGCEARHVRDNAWGWTAPVLR